MTMMDRVRGRECSVVASGRDTNCCTSPDGFKWVDAGSFCQLYVFSGFDADELDEVREIGKAAERLLPARLVLSPCRLT